MTYTVVWLSSSGFYDFTTNRNARPESASAYVPNNWFLFRIYSRQGSSFKYEKIYKQTKHFFLSVNMAMLSSSISLFAKNCLNV